MTPREFLAVAVLLSTSFDKTMRGLAGLEASDPLISAEAREWWTARADEHARRIGAKRALWLEAAPCGWWAATPKPGHETQTRHRIDPEDWNPCCEPATAGGMCAAHATAAAELAAVCGS